jgi:DNA-binding MarR family transcriptional regulator
MNLQSDDALIAHTQRMAAELRVVLGRLKRRLRQESPLGGLTPSQRSVLGLLEREGPATVTTLARVEGVRPQSMGATIATLEAAGMVAGAPDPLDGRQTILSLTEASRAWIKDNRAARDDWLLRSIQAKYSSQEQQELSHAITLLKRLVEP